MGGGLASEMIKRLVEDNTSVIDVVRLEVNAANERARRFYTKNGFIGYPGDNSDSIIMERCVIA